MKPVSRFSSVLLCLSLTTVANAQVPDGYVVFGTFSSGATTTGRGIFFAHPRDASAPIIPVGNLPANLSNVGSGSRGVASLMRRGSDGALLVGERAPTNASVDFHVLRLTGDQVSYAQLFSCGTSGGAGEITQFGLLPDGQVVIAATGLLPGGIMAQFTNGSYGWQGLAILDTDSGTFTAVPVTNWSSFVGVMNGMAVSRDGQHIYLGAYISASAGDLWEIPIAGGTAVQVAALPFGDSNVAIDQDDTVLLTTLNGPPNFFRYDPISTQLTVIATASGALNAVALEPSTGNYYLATANAGTPPRSLLWRTPTGADVVLQATPTDSTISAISANPNPENFGSGTPGMASYRWQTTPNPGGLPLAGNSNFSLTVTSNQPMLAFGFVMLGYATASPFSVAGVDVLVDPNQAIFMDAVLVDTVALPIPLPANPNIVGFELFAQSFWLEPSNAFVASDGVSMTVM